VALIEQRTQAALPNETGGVLVGVTIDERPVVVAAVEHADPDAGPCTFAVPAGETERIVADARTADDRLCYLGDWHSHPSGAEPSDLDAATMLAARRLSGTDRPVLLLGGRDGDGRVRVRAFVATRRGLVEATVCPVGDPLPPSDGATT
jgi:proteasome lid subunit RPN8/RPN11